MIRLLDKTRIPFFDYFYLFALIIYAGNASAFVVELGDIRTIGNAVALILTFIFASRHKVHIDRQFIIVIAIVTIYSLMVSFATHSFHYFLWEYSRWLIFLYIAFVTCKGFGYRFFVVAETIIYHLCVISLICWVFLLFIPGPFTTLISTISLPWRSEDYHSYNIIVYTINEFVTSEALSDMYIRTRNAGFAWEPGGFACFICFGLLFNMVRTDLKLEKNMPLYVFLIALASTESTTGIVTFGLMLLVWLLIKKQYGWIIILIPAMFLIMSLPFMGDKIMLQAEGYDSVSVAGAYEGEKYDRILSFSIYLELFKESPLLGYGYSQSIIEQNDIKLFSGIGQLLAQYGAIISILFFWSLIKSSIRLGQTHKNPVGLTLVVAMLGLMISYKIWSQPFFMAILLSYLFMDDYHKHTYYSDIKIDKES